MYQKYSRFCCSEQRLPTVIGSDRCCNPRPPPYLDSEGEIVEPRVAIPESVRVRSQVCIPYVRPGRSSTLCAPGQEETPTPAEEGTPGTEAPVEVRTTAASEYTSLLGEQTLNAATNISNPDTRFQQYFPEQPPIPLEIICPERIPNPVTVRDRFCVPQGVFAASTPVPVPAP